MLRIVLFALLAFCAPASAQIYQYTDANGNTVFSDQAPEGKQAQFVELPPINSMPGQVISKEPENTPSAEESSVQQSEAALFTLQRNPIRSKTAPAPQVKKAP